MFLFMFIIVLSVTIVCYPENVALIFKSCAIYLYLCFKILFSRLLFFYPWLQYFRRESDPMDVPQPERQQVNVCVCVTAWETAGESVLCLTWPACLLPYCPPQWSLACIYVCFYVS